MIIDAVRTIDYEQLPHERALVLAASLCQVHEPVVHD